MDDVTSRMISAERAPAALLSWCLMVAIPFTASASASDGVLAQIELAGTELILHTEQGARLAGQDLVGAEIDLPGLGTMRVDGASLDESSRFGDIWLYQLQARMPGGNAFEQVCEPDGEGDTRAVLFPGDFDDCRVVMADATACITTHGMAGCQQPWQADPPPATAMAKQRDGSQASHDTDKMVPAVSSRIRGSLAASPCPRNRCRRSDRVSIPRGPC